MKNNQKYWEERIILKDKLLEKDINKIEKKLLKLFKDTRKEVLNELKIIYADIESTEYAKYRIDSLLMSIDNILDSLYKKNEEQVEEGLKEIYKRFDKEASIDLGASFNTINENLIREAIKTNWSGLSFSERIWEHRRRLAFTIKGELTKGLTRGDSLQDMSRIITDKLNNSYSNAFRLVRTESCFIMNEATINNYKNNGVKEYEFMAFLDKKTSPQCRELDGKIISVEKYKAGLNFPPLHPNCRSCIVPVVEDIIIDKPKPKEVDPIKALEDKGVKIDVDSFKSIDKRLFKENIEQLNYLIDKYPKVQDYINKYPFSFSCGDLGKSTVGCCMTDFEKSQINIALNRSKYSNYFDLIEDTRKHILSEWTSKSLDDKLSVKTLTHEFGHVVHNILIENYNKKHKDELEKHIQEASKSKNMAEALFEWDNKLIKSFNKEIIEIARETNRRFRRNSQISRYGNVDANEFFAECFSEYECDGSTEFAKAMGIFLERNFK